MASVLPWSVPIRDDPRVTQRIRVGGFLGAFFNLFHCFWETDGVFLVSFFDQRTSWRIRSIAHCINANFHSSRIRR